MTVVHKNGTKYFDTILNLEFYRALTKYVYGVWIISINCKMMKTAEVSRAFTICI